MTTEKVYKKGKKIWIPHAIDVWQPAIILKDYEADQMQLSIQTENSTEPKILTIKSNDEMPLLYGENLLDNDSNLASLSIIHEASVLHALRIRFDRQFMYSHCDLIMIALNPFIELQFDENEKISKYKGQFIGSTEPHIFAWAEKAYCRLESENCDQSIIFTGESGAGKTENAKLAIFYLVSIGTQESQLKEKILASATVLQAFGNAKTIRNYDSSRFGKFLEIQYDTNYQIIGAKLRTYFFDKTRVTFQTESEKNFDIFYQLRSAKDRFPNLHLDEVEFSYLNENAILAIDDVHHLKCFNKTIEALNSLGFSTKQQENIFHILVAILYFGNLKIISNTTEAATAESCFISDANDLNILMKLLSLDARVTKDMRKCLCHKKIISKGNEISQPLTVDQAIKARNSLAKFIYVKLFNWIVTQINTSFRSPCNVQSFIGIFDFSGFEKIYVNCFEQFCINYAEEKVQQHFIQSIFKKQQMICEQEGIKWNFKIKDNTPCVDLFDGKSGIIEILDIESKNNDSSNTKMSDETIISKWEKTKHFAKSLHNENCFIIYHFVDAVEYTMDKFIDKNRENVVREQLEVLKNTKNVLLHKIVYDEYSKLPCLKAKIRTSNTRRSSLSVMKNTRKTIISEYCHNLGSLISMLNSTTPHYVRCIKSNDEKAIFKFDSSRVAEQLRTFNVVEAIKLSATSYSNHQTYADFVQRYHCLCKYESINRDNAQETCRKILATLFDRISPSKYKGLEKSKISKNESDKVKYGENEIFLRDETIQILERLRAEKRHRASVIIQKTARRYLQREQYTNIQNAIIRIQRFVRAYLKQKHKEQAVIKEKAAIKIQRCVRDWLERKRIPNHGYDSLEHLVKTFEKRNATVVEFKFEKNYKTLENIIIVQSCVRKFLAKAEVKRLKEAKIRDEKVELSKVSIGDKMNFVEQRINNMIKKHFTPTEKKEVNAQIDDRMSTQARNRIISNAFLEKIKKIKELDTKKEKNFSSPEVEHPEQRLCEIRNQDDNDGDHHSAYSIFRDLFHDESDCLALQSLYQYHRKFDQRAEKLKQTLGLDDEEIERLRSLRAEENDQNLSAGSDDAEVGILQFMLAEVSNKSFDDDPLPSHDDREVREGLIQFNFLEIDAIMNRIFDNIRPSLIIEHSVELPAQIIFMCIRYADILNDLQLAYDLIHGYQKAMIRANKKNRPGLDLTILYLVINHQLLNYLKQFSENDHPERNEIYAIITFRQTRQRMRNLDLSRTWQALSGTGKALAKKISRQIKLKISEFIIPAITDNDEVVNLEGDAEVAYVYELQPVGNSLTRLCNELTNIHELMKHFNVDRKIIEQLFRQLLDFLTHHALCHILGKKELLNVRHVMQIRCNLQILERWITDHQLSPAMDALRPLVQALRFYSIQPIEVANISWICENYNSLTYNQILKILKSYKANNCDESISQAAVDQLISKLAEKEELDDTVILDADMFPVEFPFRYSNVRLEAVEIPAEFNLPMLKKL